MIFQITTKAVNSQNRKKKGKMKHKKNNFPHDGTHVYHHHYRNGMMVNKSGGNNNNKKETAQDLFH